MRGLGRWFSVIYSQEELLFEKLSEGVWGGGVRGSFWGAFGKQSIKKTHYFAVWQGGVAASSRAGVFSQFPQPAAKFVHCGMALDSVAF